MPESLLQGCIFNAHFSVEIHLLAEILAGFFVKLLLLFYAFSEVSGILLQRLLQQEKPQGRHGVNIDWFKYTSLGLMTELNRNSTRILVTWELLKEQRRSRGSISFIFLLFYNLR